MRKRPVRTPIRSLVAAIMLFEMLAFLLVALHPERQETEALQALGLALCMPALCWFSTLILPKFLHADRLLMALMNFLCGVGVVILFSMVPERGVRQAMFYALGLVAMAVCILLVRHVRSWRALCWLSAAHRCVCAPARATFRSRRLICWMNCSAGGRRGSRSVRSTI